LLDLRDYVGVLRRRKQLGALIALIAAGAAIAWTAMQPRVYSATAEVLVAPPVLAVGDTTSTRMFVAAGERGIETVSPGLSEVIEGGRRAWESLRSGRIDNLWVMSSRKGYEGLAAAVAGDTWNAGGEQGPVGARLEPLRRRSAG
jgi:uncharacterized circularly permuted ATP-grasp superfamily protein